jgi:hypothetical protein
MACLRLLSTSSQLYKLSYETWDSLFENYDKNKKLWRPRHISFRYAVNGPTKPQEALINREAEYFRQLQASLFWPIRTAATAYKKALAGNFGHRQLWGSVSAGSRPIGPGRYRDVEVALRAYSYEPASEPMLTDSAEIQDAK